MDKGQASIDTLRAVLDAFNAHDLDRIMTFFRTDCVLDMPRGPDPWGTRYVGATGVKDGLRTRFAGIPDVRYEDDTHFVSGDIGVSQWTLRGTSHSGQPIEVRGCDPKIPLSLQSYQVTGSLRQCRGEDLRARRLRRGDYAELTPEKTEYASKCSLHSSRYRQATLRGLELRRETTISARPTGNIGCIRRATGEHL